MDSPDAMSEETAPDSSGSLTSEQAAAITADCSVALSAGAGCGKTHVLTHRYLSHLNPGGETGLENLIAITFTERAAREMRNRIRLETLDRLRNASDDDAEHWLRLWRSLETARVSTIHSFCASLLRSHAVEAGLDPRFTILEPAQSATLLSEILVDALREKLAERDEAAMELAYHYDLRGLQNMLADMIDEAGHIDFSAWEDVGSAELVSRWRTFLEEEVWPPKLRRLEEQPETLEVLQALQENVPTGEVMLNRRKILLELLPTLSDAAAETSPQEVLEQVVQNARVSPGGGKKCWESEAGYQAVKDGLTWLRKQAGDLVKKFVWNEPHAIEAAELGLRLLQLTRGIVAAYEQRKKELRTLDFDDLVCSAQRLLADPNQEALRERLSSSVALLMVDEFQDTDPVQADLARMLCGDQLASGRLFVVGDYKQSIYRFRGADPDVFQAIRQQIPEEGRLPLTRNFRSQPAILHFVNHLFCRDLIGFEGYEPLIAHHPQLSPTPCVEFLW
ncbi:MAG: UvrD-helicase domain-containing protein, partial [Planctomycetales bacterium]